MLVEPALVAEIMVDTAQERGSWRHPLRFARIRDDLMPVAVPLFGDSGT
ncbi:hypothetical protein [Streptomyces sp. NPDC029674]